MTMGTTGYIALRRSLLNFKYGDAVGVIHGEEWKQRSPKLPFPAKEGDHLDRATVRLETISSGVTHIETPSE